MHNHEKPTVRDFDLDHIILHCVTTGRTSSQVVREIIHPARSLKSDKNKISISLLRPQSGKLNNKASEVNNCLMNTCSNQNIAYIGRSISALQNYINTHSKI